jgi:putative endonuclease
METTYKVYVLKNSTGKFYVGVSEDVARRLEQHNAGESEWTAKFRPWAIAWTSDPMSLSSARRLENLLKKQKGGRGFYRITGLPPPDPGS